LLEGVPFGNSSLLLGWVVRHDGLLEPCPGDRLNGVPGGTQAARIPGGAYAPGHGQGGRVARAAARERGTTQAAHRTEAVQAGRPTVARGAVLVDTQTPVGAGVSGDTRDPACLAPPPFARKWTTACAGEGPAGRR